MARVVEHDPDFKSVALIPASIRGLLERCLQKDPRQRTRDIGDVRLELEGLATAEPDEARSPGRGRGAAITA